MVETIVCYEQNSNGYKEIMKINNSMRTYTKGWEPHTTLGRGTREVSRSEFNNIEGMKLASYNYLGRR